MDWITLLNPLLWIKKYIWFYILQNFHIKLFLKIYLWYSDILLCTGWMISVLSLSLRHSTQDQRCKSQVLSWYNIKSIFCWYYKVCHDTISIWFSSGACDWNELISINILIVLLSSAWCWADSTAWMLRKEVRSDGNGDTDVLSKVKNKGVF